jgi:pathogenesis-related protein 1
LLGLIKHNENGAEIVVRMHYPKNNIAAAKNALAMLKTFRSNATGTNNPTIPVPPKTENPDVTQPVPDNSKPTMDITKVLLEHNKYRTALGISDLTWSPTLANYAQEWANELAKNRNCKLQHRPHDANSKWNLIYGENIFSGSSGYTAVDAVNNWGSEKQFFNASSKTCNDGAVCGHYTQIVWKITTKVGCAVAKCANGNIIVVCNYDPAGNMMGEKPY